MVTGSEAPREVLGAPLLLNAGETPGVSMDRDPGKMAVERAAKFIIRGSLILLWLYLFKSMREYAISYTGGDIAFSTFATIVVAIPIAEMFCILGQTLVPPLSRPPIIGSSMPCAACGYACTNSDVPTKEVDLEKGPSAHTTMPVPPEDAMRRAAIQAALDMDAARTAKCIVRGLLILLWVYLVDLMRRFIVTHELGEVLLFTMTPLLILAVGVSFFLCFLMESCGELILPTKSSHSAMLELD